MAELAPILDHLEGLVGFDTQNPPRDITADAPLFAWLTERLPGFEIEILDYGDGCLAYHARRGAPDLLFNVHLDTVPIARGWTTDPHALTRGNDRCIGLGACDIKGAAAALIAVAAETDAPCAFLFSTDEEAGKSDAIRGFLREERPYTRVVVAEPTKAAAATEHRGIFSGQLRFAGTSAHASSSGSVSAIHEAARLITAANEDSGFADLRLNFGRIEGGVKPNMVAAECTVLFGFRCPPGERPEPRLMELERLAGDHRPEITTRFVGPALPGGGPEATERQADYAGWLSVRNIPLSPPVHFWTEASLFSEGGYPVCVLGPGDIAQAHTADEFVHYEQLIRAADLYRTLIDD